jgi:hypothetical protein
LMFDREGRNFWSQIINFPTSGKLFKFRIFKPSRRCGRRVLYVVSLAQQQKLYAAARLIDS